MKTNKLIRKFFILLIAVTLLVGGLGAWILNHTGQIFEAYPYIPLFFGVLGVCYIFLLKYSASQTPKKMIILFMTGRMVKLLLSILFLIVYGVLAKSYIEEAVITFLFFYLIYLVMEVGFFLALRKDDKEKLK